MKQMTTIKKLGKMVTDKVTGLKGMLTHFVLDQDGNRNYFFQPALLSKETGKPIDSYWLGDSRVVGGKEVQVSLPTEVLSTQVEDIATGFKGTACNVELHINGCVHVMIKPKGLNMKGQPIDGLSFDIRRLKGKKVPKYSEEELEESTKKKPSPATHKPMLKQ